MVVVANMLKLIYAAEDRHPWLQVMRSQGTHAHTHAHTRICAHAVGGGRPFRSSRREAGVVVDGRAGPLLVAGLGPRRSLLRAPRMRRPGRQHVLQ